MKENYYVGLDIGTNSIGYAVTDEHFNLLKYKGEPMWGSHVFEEGKQCAERRAYRTARRRLNRRQQRVHLTQQIFAKAIGEIDKHFFIRLKESALFREDTSGRDTYIFFQDKTYTDKEYHRDYPTIHHLIKELMEDKTPHDVRLVYLAVAWLMAHRGHFLSEVNKDNIAALLDFDSIYGNFMELFSEKPWMCDDKEKFKSILLLNQTVRNKERQFWDLLYAGKKPKTEEEDHISKEGIIKLLGACDKDKQYANTVERQELLSKIYARLLNIETELHELKEWSLLLSIYEGKTSVNDEFMREFLFICGENGHAAINKLNVSPDTNIKDMVHIAEERCQYWRAKYNSTRNISVKRALPYETISKSYEMLGARIREQHEIYEKAIREISLYNHYIYGRE